MAFLSYAEEPKLEELQRLVGGYVEVASGPGIPESFTLLVNEEGLLEEAPSINHVASAVCGSGVLVGDAALLLYPMS